MIVLFSGFMFPLVTKGMNIDNFKQCKQPANKIISHLAQSRQYPALLPENMQRKSFLKILASGFFIGSSMASSNAAPAFADTKNSFEQNLANILLSKKVLEPALRYIQIGQYDPARTNVNFCVNQLKLRKALVAAVDEAQDFVEDFDLLSEAIEFVTRADNIIVQLDSSIYTMIFIPVESSDLPPDAIKFQKQCFLYYDLTLKGLDEVIALATPEQLKKANEIAAQQKLPAFLFKEFKGDFYRPGTP